MRRHWGRLLAGLIGGLQDFALAEDALQDAVEQALTQWPARGIPDRPDAWLFTVARRRALNQLARQDTFDRKRAELATLARSDPIGPETMDDEIPDERLRLIFTCCHPALGLPARVALTLRTVVGLSTPQIARAFMVTEATMAQRLVRAKRKISGAAIPYRIPPPEQWAERLDAVLYVVYFIFNEGYSSAGAPAALIDEALHLAEVLRDLAPAEPEIAGLLALMLFHDSRRAARVDARGRLRTLEDQDRVLWDRAKIRSADRILKTALAQGSPGPYQLQAAISGVHAHAERFADTDWAQIVQLYALLEECHPSPVVSLNAAVAASFAGPLDAALERIGALAQDRAMLSYQPFHAARADILRRLGRRAEAHRSYARALELSHSPSERAFLEARLDETR